MAETMFTTATSPRTAFGIACLLIGTNLARLSAEEDSGGSAATQVLKEKGLRVVSGVVVVADEALVSRMLKEIPSHRKLLIEGGKRLAAAESAVLEREATIQQCLEQRRQLNAQMATVESVVKHNRLVAAINELTDRINLLSDSEKVETQRREVRAGVNELREKYVEHILSIRKTYDRVAQQYADLSADAKVTEAISALNQASPKKEVKLGPSRAFLSAGKSLKTLEETVLSEEIPLQRADGGVFRVSVVVNGSKPVDFVLDTGAGILSIPEPVAREIGIEVSDSAPVIQLQMADGRVIEARQAVAKSVRVGKFTLENVACAVLPPAAVLAEPLLGQTFLGQFSYKVESDRSVLVMTRVDGDQGTDKPRSGKKGKKPKP